MLDEAPDILGGSVLPAELGIGTDALLARLDFLGNIHIDAVTLFEERAVLPSSYREARRLTLESPLQSLVEYADDDYDKQLMHEGTTVS